MTEIQRDAISNKVEGLMVYQTTSPNGFYYFTGTVWKKVGNEEHWIANNDTLYSMPDSLVTIKGNRVGIGTKTPDYQLEVVGNQGTGHIGITTYRPSLFGAGNFSARAARGTKESPAGLLEGDYLASLSARGYGDTGFSGPSPQGRIGFIAAENWTDTTQGTHMLFSTTPIGDRFSSERMRISSGGNVGIGTQDPFHLLEVIGNSGASGTPIAYFENTCDTVNGQLVDAYGIMGVCDRTDWAGYGVYGRGGFIGVRGRVYAQDTFTYYGMSGTAGGGAGHNIGTFGNAFGGGHNEGIFGSASGGHTNYAIRGHVDTSGLQGAHGSYAGFFEGDVFVRDRLGVGTDLPSHKLEVIGDSKAQHTPIAYFENTCDTVNGQLVDAYGVMGICQNQDYAGYGGVFRGGFMGALAEVNPTDTFYYYGMLASASGGAGVNHGIYGWAQGDGVNRAVRGYANGSNINYGIAGLARNGQINYGVFGQADTSGVTGTYAGYFQGDVHISNSLGIGTITPTEQLEVSENIKATTIKTENIAHNKSVTVGGWSTNPSAMIPSDLSNAVDEDESTQTTSGVTYSSGNQGYIIIDLDTVYSGTAFVRMDVRNENITGILRYEIQSSVDSLTWITNSVQYIWLDQNWKTIYPATAFWGRYLRVVAIDDGHGQVALRLSEAYIRRFH
jgi:hypothetical protein